MKVVILGCGRVGSILALDMANEGHDVTIIDRNKEAFRRLTSRFKGRALTGNGVDEDVLKKAGIETADAFVAVSQGDNTNLAASQIAQRRFNVPTVLCRCYDPIRAQVFKELGLQTIPTAQLQAGMLKDRIMGQPIKSIAEYIGEDGAAAEEGA